MFLEHVAAGLTTAGIITAARNRGSLVLLFTNKAHHLAIHRHHVERHGEHFTACEQGDCKSSDLQTLVAVGSE